ncbi:MAG: hypothetical protein FJY92_08205 [Candidatus Hydrogenedentes bacterium]|nr:hypothetical protein [Candidatus Hydrogenedentota bacterium]
MEPFNLPGAEEWMAAPAHVVPSWLNAELLANNMPVRVPAVAIVAAQENAYQFRGVLSDANGQILGSIAGTYYVNDPAGRFDHAMEGNYEYTLPDGSVDADTFEFSE